MSLKEQMAADSAVFTNVDDFGEYVKFVPKDGATIEQLPVLFTGGVVDSSGRLMAIENQGTFVFAVALVADVTPGDIFIRGNKTWKVDRDSELECDGVSWRIKLVLSRIAGVR